MTFIVALMQHGRVIVIERLILGAFLMLPLLIVAFLFPTNSGRNIKNKRAWTARGASTGAIHCAACCIGIDSFYIRSVQASNPTYLPPLDR